MAMDGRARVPASQAPPVHHDRRSPPGSPAGLLVDIDEGRPRGVAPPPSDRFAFLKSTSSVGPSAHRSGHLSALSAHGTRNGSALRRSRPSVFGPRASEGLPGTRPRQGGGHGSAASVL